MQKLSAEKEHIHIRKPTTTAITDQEKMLNQTNNQTNKDEEKVADKLHKAISHAHKKTTTEKQTNKNPNKQTNKQASKQVKWVTDCCCFCLEIIASLRFTILDTAVRIRILKMTEVLEKNWPPF